jgi:hypothetical protein
MKVFDRPKADPGLKYSITIATEYGCISARARMRRGIASGK